MNLEYMVVKVTRTSSTGFQVDGQPGWVNVSQFAPPPPEIPAVGEVVKIGLDGKGYVRTIEPVQPEPSWPACSPLPDAQLATIRIGVLNAAIEYMNGTGGLGDVADVLGIASQFEEWVLREE